MTEENRNTNRTKIEMPEAVCFIIDTLQKAGFEAYAVGGCVRDALLSRTPHDWDITTSAKPEQVKALFSRTIDTGLIHGTVTILYKKTGYEVTTYRVDGAYEDGRHPKEVSFTASLSQDLERRDFTINAMAYNHEKGIVDLFGGTDDLSNGIIRCVGDPMERFSEDALRILRAVRFAAQLEFSVEEKTAKAVCTLAETLKKISVERIAAEIGKLLESAHPEYFDLCHKNEITAVILPEYDALSEEARSRSMQRVQLVEAEKHLRYAALFWEMGADTAVRILRRLKLDNDTISAVKCLILASSDFPLKQDSDIRREIHKIGKKRFSELLLLQRADAKTGEDADAILRLLDEEEERFARIVERKDACSLKELCVDGRDLLALGIEKGPMLGAVLADLLDLVLEDPANNEKSRLIPYIEEYLSRKNEAATKRG